MDNTRVRILSTNSYTKLQINTSLFNIFEMAHNFLFFILLWGKKKEKKQSSEKTNLTKIQCTCIVNTVLLWPFLKDILFTIKQLKQHILILHVYYIKHIYIYESTNKMENLGIKSFHLEVTATLACLTVTYIVNFLSFKMPYG